MCHNEHITLGHVCYNALYIPTFNCQQYGNIDNECKLTKGRYSKLFMYMRMPIMECNVKFKIIVRKLPIVLHPCCSPT